MKDVLVNIELDFNQVANLTNNLQDAGNAALQGAWDGIEYLSDIVYSHAWMGCPIATGTLRSSLYKEVEVTGSEVTANVGHGGKYNRLNILTGKMSDSYAVEMHEGWKISAKNGKFGATRKWLEKAVHGVGPIFENVLCVHIQAALAGASEEQLSDALHAMYQQMNSKVKHKVVQPQQTKPPDFHDAPPEGSLLAKARAVMNK